jgi:hypothetical protein
MPRQHLPVVTQLILMMLQWLWLEWLLAEQVHALAI